MRVDIWRLPAGAAGLSVSVCPRLGSTFVSERWDEKALAYGFVLQRWPGGHIPWLRTAFWQRATIYKPVFTQPLVISRLASISATVSVIAASSAGTVRFSPRAKYVPR